jgi:hypothetical protein
MTDNATAAITFTGPIGNVYQYTITLADTGTTAIGTFWFGWVPGQDYMSQRPTAIGSPNGWTSAITGGGTGDGFAIQWIAGAESAIQPGGVSAAFTFSSTETPQQMAAASPFHADPPTTTSVTYTGGPFSSAGDTIVASVEAACFREGTRIRTSRGDLPVERLRPGDQVVTASAECRPVIWIGRRHVDCGQHSDPRRVWPVCVVTGALGPSIPGADLYLSPDHALFLYGVLVPVKYLINGTTITQIPAEAVTWYHLELESHDVVLAEGAPAESYLDTGDRAKFEATGDAAFLFARASTPDRAPFIREAVSDLPLVVTGPLLMAIRRRLAERAEWVRPLVPMEYALPPVAGDRREPAWCD